jgi:hypothetical protein
VVSADVFQVPRSAVFDQAAGPDQVIKEADLQDPRASLKGEKLDA